MISKKHILNLLDHPDIIIPYTPREETRKKKYNLKFKSDITMLKIKGY